MDTIELEIWDRDPTVSDPCKPAFLSLRQVEPGVYEGSLPDDNIVYRVNLDGRPAIRLMRLTPEEDYYE